MPRRFNVSDRCDSSYWWSIEGILSFCCRFLGYIAMQSYINRCFGESIARLPNLLLHSGFLFGWFSTSKMDVMFSSETSVHIRTTRHCIPEGGNCFENLESYINKTKTKPVGLSTQANYTGWATATCRRNLVPTFADRGVSRGQRGGSPTVVNLSFLDRSRYFFFQISPYLCSRGLSGPRSRPTSTQKIW
jgi:hypothetical protein